jgi:putative tryptophan/tyrosine transport system substrate-binding protein
MRPITVLVSFALVLSLFVGCEKPSNDRKVSAGGTRTVVVLTPLSHPSLDQAIDGFRQGLSEKGYSGEKIRIELKNASGDFTKIASITKASIDMGPALIFVLTTSAASEAIKLTNPAGIPLVYTAATDPVAAGVVSDMSKSETLATGVSDRYPVKEQVETFMRISPNIKTAGLLFNPEEENSRILVEQTIQALEEKGVVGKKYLVNDVSQVSSRTKQAISESDCIIVNGDNLLTENLAEVISLCIAGKKPLFVGDPDSVRKGAVATVGPSYFSLGRQSGFKAAQILAGEDPRTIPSEYPRAFDYVINTNAAKAMGVEIGSDTWASRQIWESKASASDRDARN